MDQPGARDICRSIARGPMVGVIKKQKPSLARDVRIDGSRRPDGGQVDLRDEPERRRLPGPSCTLDQKIEMRAAVIDLCGFGREGLELVGRKQLPKLGRLGPNSGHVLRVEEVCASLRRFDPPLMIGIWRDARAMASWPEGLAFPLSWSRPKRSRFRRRLVRFRAGCTASTSPPGPSRQRHEPPPRATSYRSRRRS